MSDLQVTLSESPNPRYIYVSPDNIVHLMVPIISADDIGIGLDNTCQSVVALQEFFGLKHDSNLLRDSALDKLREYRLQLENDIETMRSFNQDPILVEDRLRQVTNYTTLLQKIKNNYGDTLNSLNGSYPRYPRAFRNIFARPDSNLYAMLLKPEHEDNALRANFHLFAVRRNSTMGVNGTPLYDTLNDVYDQITQFAAPTQREQFINKVAERLNAIQFPILTGSLKNRIQDALAQSYREFSKDDVFTEQNVFNALIALAWDDDEHIQSLNQLKNEVLSGIIGSNENLEFPADSEFNLLKEVQERERTEKLSIMTQFLLAEINIYAQSHNLLVNRTNFGGVLDNDMFLSLALANVVRVAIQDGLSVEDAVCGLINRNSACFGLNKQLDAADIKLITELFNVHYKAVKAADHKDEFITIDLHKPKNVLFFIHQKSICCDFTELLQSDEYQYLNFDQKFERVSRQEVPQMPVTLPPRKTSDVGAIKITEEDLKIIITNAIVTCNYIEIQKLLLKVNNKFIFQILGSDYFNQFSTNKIAKYLFTRLRATINDTQTSNLFNQVVLGHRSQLLLTPKMARSLYVAVQDRRELPIERVLQYSTPEAVKLILDDLFQLSSTNEFSIAFQNIKHFTVSAGSNGNLIIDAPEQTIQTLQAVIDEYQDSFHLAMVMASSIYKQVLENYGETHPQYIEMNRLSNNVPGDKTPYKFLKALELLGITIRAENIRYNNTKNSFEYKTLANARDGNPKKGGSGYIVDNLALDALHLIEALTETYANKFNIPLVVEQALFNQINQLQAYNILESFTSRRDRLEAALILLDIKFRRMDYLFDKNQFVVYMDQKEQAKIKYINSRFACDDTSGLVYNNEDKQYTLNYTPRIITPTATQGTLLELVTEIMAGTTRAESSDQPAPSNLADQSRSLNPNSERETFKITPDMARSIYVAVQDRRQLPFGRTLKYLTPHFMTNLLDELHTLGVDGNPDSQGFQAIANFDVTAAADGAMNIRAPKEAIRILRQITETYSNTIHLAIPMSAALDKEVEERFGSESAAFKNMQLLENNKLGDPIGYKMLEAFRLLGINIPMGNLRYNNTKNALEFKNADNKDDGLEKKGGSGFIIENIDQASLSQIEEICERQAYRFVMDGFFEFSIYETIDRLQDPDANQLLRNCGEDRRAKLETALMLLGIECRQVLFNQTDNRFVMQANLTEQSKIKFILRHAFDIEPIDQPIDEAAYDRKTDQNRANISGTILLFNDDDRQRTKNYIRSIIPGNNLARSIEGIKVERQNLAPLPLALPYRHSLQTNSPRDTRAINSVEVPAVPVREVTTETAGTIEITTVPDRVVVNPDVVRPVVNPQAVAPVAPNKDAIIRVLLDLINNINNKESGRKSWFTYNTDSKVGKLQVVLDWMNNSTEEVVTLNKMAVLTLIRDICAIKRNPIGFFSPHSLVEFEDKINDLTEELIVPGVYSSTALSRLDASNIYNVLQILDNQISPRI